MQISLPLTTSNSHSTVSVQDKDFERYSTIVNLSSAVFLPARGGSGTSQMGGGIMGSTIPARGPGPQYSAELRILLVYLSESLGRLG